MKTTYRFLIATVMMHFFWHLQAKAQTNPLKKVTVQIVDATTGKPIEGADLLYKGVLAKQKQKTNAQGIATFNIYVLLPPVTVTIDVKDNNSTTPHSATSVKITLTQDKEFYTYTASLQPDTKLEPVVFKVFDAENKPLPFATAKLKNNKGEEVTVLTDANGNANFNIVPIEFSNANLTILKDGKANYSLPVDIYSNFGTLSINVPEEYSDKNSSSTKQLGPTNSSINSALPTGYKPSITIATPICGPYIPTCSTKPVDEVPPYSAFFVADDKDLLDYISESCIGSASDAVDALTTVVLLTQNISSQCFAIWNAEKAKPIANIDASKKILQDNAEDLKTAFAEAKEKCKDLYDNMKALAGGPELYAATCIWSGIKSYGTSLVNPEFIKIKKGLAGFDKAKNAIKEKIAGFEKWIASGKLKPETAEEKALLTDWGDIKNDAKTTLESFTTFVSMVSNPLKLLPAETQLDIALLRMDGLIANLISDCQIRKADLALKDGIDAGQQALNGARKLYAQMRKNELKEKEKIYQRQKNYYWEQLNFDPGILGWDTWKKYQEERVKAGKSVNQIENKLRQLALYCEKLQPIANTLNERVTKYEAIYASALASIEACNLDEITVSIKQMQALENSDCGHFFPKPYGMIQSKKLMEKLAAAKASGKCTKTKGVGTYVLKRTQFEPNSSNKNFTITTSTIVNNSQSCGYTFTLNNQPPNAITPGGSFPLSFTGSTNCNQNGYSVTYFAVATWYSSLLNYIPGEYSSGDYATVGKVGGRGVSQSSNVVTIKVPDYDQKELILKMQISGTVYSTWVNFIYEKQ